MVFSVTKLPSPSAKMNFINNTPSAGTILTNNNYMISNMQSEYAIPIHNIVTIISDT